MRDLGVGIGYLVKGQRWVAQHGRWWGIGMIPALITLVGYAAALVVLFYWTLSRHRLGHPPSPTTGPHPGSAPSATRSRSSSAPPASFLAVITFTAVTLLVGQPFYESLSEEVDRSEGGEVPESGLSTWQEVWIGIREALALLIRVTLWSVLFFALGFIPFIGQTVIPALALCVTGFFLAEELTSVALLRRGVLLKERRRMLRGRRLLTVGFGLPLALLFLLPLVAVFLMPGAVAGATLLVRDLTGEAAAPPQGDTAAGALGSA
ncbi:putative integral membrane protein [Streptomyces himastatinicus ATCC 53653]|uniref:Putative integral membrane protein n=1 Tax=Streptomyces himastatinicus ATCC 53653 TaxID=457427 RepID=D9WUP0_9ACTN|nr:EI24 domain-containing protein [Streptomyces himastatinicus]EFL26422.1 putative integral membrane protein [Streptomyces himastatinicus ATCC 53653]